MNDKADRESRGAAALGEPDSDTTATVATILAEVRDTGSSATRDQVAEMIRARLDRAGIALPENEVDDLVAQIVEGDESA